MQWDDRAILLSVRKHGENSAVIRLFSRTHGVYAGVVKYIHSKTNRGIFQPGNVVDAHWSARLPEQMGSFKLELLEPVAAHLMSDAERLSALTSACILYESALPERHRYESLYDVLHRFLTTLKTSEFWWEDYVRLELEILADSGFGLDLSTCAATGAHEDLIYVSPKSGRAVSRSAGEPYKEKLLLLPDFLIEGHKKNRVESPEILAGLHLTGYFLAHWLLEPHGRKLPAIRDRLLKMMKEKDAA